MSDDTMEAAREAWIIQADSDSSLRFAFEAGWRAHAAAPALPHVPDYDSPTAHAATFAAQRALMLRERGERLAASLREIIRLCNWPPDFTPGDDDPWWAGRVVAALREWEQPSGDHGTFTIDTRGPAFQFLPPATSPTIEGGVVFEVVDADTIKITRPGHDPIEVTWPRAAAVTGEVERP